MDEAMNAMKRENQPVYVFDSKYAPKAVVSNSSSVLSGDISHMIEGVQDIARENLQLKKDLKIQA